MAPKGASKCIIKSQNQKQFKAQHCTSCKLRQTCMLNNVFQMLPSHNSCHDWINSQPVRDPKENQDSGQQRGRKSFRYMRWCRCGCGITGSTIHYALAVSIKIKNSWRRCHCEWRWISTNHIKNYMNWMILLCCSFLFHTVCPIRTGLVGRCIAHPEPQRNKLIGR